MGTLLSLQNVSFGYYPTDERTGEPTGEICQVLSDISMDIREGGYHVLCGATGCGKSTLLRLCKKELVPVGKLDGTIRWNGAEDPGEIGFVMQNPGDQAVTDKVWHELAFGAENVGMEPGEIRRRVAEVSSYFGIGDWYDRRITELSGGQLQIVNLAAAVVMNPRLLILDEPTSQLDPIAAIDFLRILEKLNREMGITILIVEHRLEEVLPAADRVFYLENKTIAFSGTPDELMRRIPADSVIYKALPLAGRVACRLKRDPEGSIPLTIRAGRSFLEAECRLQRQALSRSRKDMNDGEGETAPVLTCRGLWFRYGRMEPDVVRGAEVNLYPGECVCLLGGNGSGKTTFLKLLAGILTPQEGTCRVLGEKIKGSRPQIGYLPQDVETMFVTDSVHREMKLVGIPDDRLTHPYDLSGGEKQQLALRKLLAAERRVLLLDEPGKGLDASAKEQLGELLNREKEKGTAILLVTHDCEFAAAYADRCGLFFHGAVVSLEEKRTFFGRNRFYTTAAARLAYGLYEGVLTEEDLYRELGVSEEEP